MHRADLIIGLIFVAFGAFVVLESQGMPRYANIGANPVTAPGLVPSMLGGILAALGLIMATRAALALRAGAREPAGPTPTEVFGVEAPIEEAPPSYIPEAKNAGRNRFVTMLAASLLFAAVAVGRLPFWLATFLFVFLTITLLERQRFGGGRAAWVRLAAAVAIAGGAAWVVPYVFESIFLVRLP